MPDRAAAPPPGQPADPDGAGQRGLRRLVGFGRYLRRRGLPVGPGRVLTFCRAAGVIDALEPEALRWAARASLVSRPEDIPVLDAAFDRYFVAGADDVADPDRGDGDRRRPPPHAPDPDAEGTPVPVAATWRSAGPEEDLEGEAAIRVVASDAERLRTKDFAELTEAERRTASAMIRRLALEVPLRPSRRFRAARAGERFDLRTTLRRSLRTEGEPFDRAWKARRTRRRPLVLILDVSGSMAPYSRPLVEFAHAASVTGRRVEAFCFGTRLTRITRAVRRRDPGEALAAVGVAVSDWEGGTRIGDSLKELLDGWSTRSALRGSIVVLCSDGLERGDPAQLARQMERLSRLAHRLVWVNPLKGSPRYEPLARGMAASLPFVDVFLPGHDLESLESLAAAVAAS